MSKHYTTANPQYIHAMRLLRRSNAARPHDPRPHRQRTRNAVNRIIIREQLND